MVSNASKSASREIGHARPAYGFIPEEDNRLLRFPQSAQTFTKMGRQDSQIIAVLKAVRLPIERAVWRIDPNGADDEVVRHVAGDLRLPILGEDGYSHSVARSRGRVSWSQHLHYVLMALVYGHMFFEQVYEVREDGREHLHKLAPRFPTTLTKINVDLDGGLESIEQVGAPGMVDHPVIPVDRLVAYIHDPWDSSWQGTSLLRAAYKHWVLRDRLLNNEVIAIDRNSLGVPVYTGSPFAKDPNADLASGQAIVEALRSDKNAGAAIPDGASLDLKGVSGQLTSPREAIVYHDSMMAKSVLAHFLNLEGKGGSYALAETQSDLFIQSLQTLGEWIADTATQHIVEDLCDVAFPDYGGTCPRIVFDPIASKKELAAEALASLVTAGIILPDRDLEEEVRRRYSYPAKRPFEPTENGGGPKVDNTNKGLEEASELKVRTEVAATLIRAGFTPESSLQAAGLGHIEHTGKEPVTIRDPNGGSENNVSSEE